MRKILFMMLMLFSVSCFAGNSLDNDTSIKDVLLNKGDSKDHSSERWKRETANHLVLCGKTIVAVASLKIR